MRVACPYCREPVWVPMSVRDLAQASYRMVEVLNTDFRQENQEVQEVLAKALAARDRGAYHQGLEQEAAIQVQALDRVGYWKISGTEPEDYIDQSVRQGLTVYDEMVEQMASPTGAQEEHDRVQRLQQATADALARQDLDGFAHAWREQLSYSLRKYQPQLTEEEVEHQIRGSMENMLRDQSWVGPAELEYLGFESVYDAEVDQEGVRSVECQGCSAPLQAPQGAEFVECPYCEAVTYLQVALSKMAQVFQESAGDLAQATWAQPDYLQLSRDAVKSSYPDLDPQSPQGRVMIFYMAEQMASDRPDSVLQGYREELGLGRGSRTCSSCSTVLAEVSPPLNTCPICRLPI